MEDYTGILTGSVAASPTPTIAPTRSPTAVPTNTPTATATATSTSTPASPTVLDGKYQSITAGNIIWQWYPDGGIPNNRKIVLTPQASFLGKNLSDNIAIIGGLFIDRVSTNTEKIRYISRPGLFPNLTNICTLYTPNPCPVPDYAFPGDGNYRGIFVFGNSHDGASAKTTDIIDIINSPTTVATLPINRFHSMGPISPSGAIFVIGRDDLTGTIRPDYMSSYIQLLKIESGTSPSAPVLSKMTQVSPNPFGSGTTAYILDSVVNSNGEVAGTVFSYKFGDSQRRVFLYNSVDGVRFPFSSQGNFRVMAINQNGDILVNENGQGQVWVKETKGYSVKPLPSGNYYFTDFTDTGLVAGYNRYDQKVVVYNRTANILTNVKNIQGTSYLYSQNSSAGLLANTERVLINSQGKLMIDNGLATELVAPVVGTPQNPKTQLLVVKNKTREAVTSAQISVMNPDGTVVATGAPGSYLLPFGQYRVSIAVNDPELGKLVMESPAKVNYLQVRGDAIHEFRVP